MGKAALRLAASGLLLALSGCYAGIAGIVLGLTAGGGSSGPPSSFWRLTGLRVEHETAFSPVVEECPGGPVPGLVPSPAPRPPEIIFAEIASLSGMEDVVAGSAVGIEFQLDLQVPPGSSKPEQKTTGVVLEVTDPAGSTSALHLGKFAAGRHRVTWDSTSHGKEEPRQLVLALGPSGGLADQSQSQTVRVDNRPVPRPLFCALSTSGCGPGQDGSLAIEYALRSTGGKSSDRPEIAAVLYAEMGESVKRVDTRTLERGTVGAASSCLGEDLEVYRTEWDTRDELGDQSGDVACCLLLEDASGRHRPVACLLPCESQRIHVNNSKPSLSDVSIGSNPRGVRVHSEDLIGRVVVELRVADAGREPCDLDIEASFLDSRSEPVELSTSRGTLTEAKGEPSEGSRLLATSPEGVTHVFVWNSDFDVDALVRAGRLSSPLATAMTLRVSVRDAAACLESEQVEQVFVLDNRVVHSVAGLAPGATAPGRLTVSRDAITFETLIASKTSLDGKTLFLVDSGAHVVWRMPFSDTADTLERIIGNGTKRFDETPPDMDRSVAVRAILDTPADVAIEGGPGPDVVHLLERSSVVWRLQEDLLRLELDGRDILNGPDAMLLEIVAGHKFLYIADTLNCRIVRHDIVSGETRVVLGDLTTVRPREDPELQAAELRASPYPLTNGCNFRTDTSVPPVEIARLVVNEPLGLALHTSSSGSRALLVSDTLNNRILAVDLDTADAPEGLPAPPPVALLTQAEHPLLCGPKGLKIVDGFLYITCLQANFEVNRSKGVLLRAPIFEDSGGFPRLGPSERVERIAGGLLRNTQPVAGACTGRLNEAATYEPVHECGIATEVPLSRPTDIAADADGNIYLCDSRNQRLRKLGWGNGTCDQPTANGEPEPTTDTGRLETFVGASVDGRSEEEAFTKEACFPRGTDPQAGFPASSFKLSEPLGMTAIGDSALLISDRGNRRILRLDLQTGLLTTLAGRLQTPQEAAERIFFAGDEGPATEALLQGPRSLAIHPRSGFCEDPDRRLYIADSLNHRVREIDGNGFIYTFAGSGSRDIDTDLGAGAAADPTRVFLKLPRSVAVDSRGRVFIGDCRHRIVRVDLDGLLRRVIGVGFIGEGSLGVCENLADSGLKPEDPEAIGDGGPALEARLNQPSEMVFDPQERFLYLADQANNRVRRVDYDAASGACGTITSVAGNGLRNNEGRFPFPGVVTRATAFPLSSPLGVALDPEGRTLFFSEVFTPCRVYRVELAEDPAENILTLLAGREVQGSVGDGDDAGKAQLFNPNSVVLDSSGKVLFVVDSRNHRIRRFSVGD